MSEPPSDDGRRSRSDAASRLAAMLADTGDDLVLPDGPPEGSDERAPDAGPSVAAIAARPAPVQPQPERPRRTRRPVRSDAAATGAAAAGAEADALDEPTRRIDVADLLADDDPVEPSAPPTSAPAGAPPATGAGAAGAEEVEHADEDDDLDEPWAWDEVVAGETDVADETGETDVDGETDVADETEADGETEAVLDEGDADDGAAVRGTSAPAAADAPPAVGADVPAAAVAGGSTPQGGDRAEPVPAAAAAARSRPTDPDPADPDPAPPAAVPEVRLRRVTLRAVAFGSVFALLVAAVPALAWVGKERLLDSRGGEVVSGGTDPTEPGYRALVVPTETALVLQRDDEGNVTAATVLALGAGEAGGTVLQVPMNTRVREQKFLFDRLSLVAANSSDELFAREVADLLNVGIPADNVVTIDDESLASLTAPVAPLTIDNPDPVVTEDGEEIPAGPVELTAEQVGPYLRATAGGEDELARLARNEMVWSAWLAAVAEAGVETGVGQGFTDIGPFIRTLAAGEPVVQTLNVTLDEESDQPEPPYVPADGFDEQILDAVPYPTSPGLGRRWELVLVNGASGDAEIPRDLMRQLIGQGAALTTLVNADVMGEEGTVVEYGGSHWRDAAERAAFVLGEDVEVERMSQARAEQAGADVVITLGSTVLDRFGEGG